MPDIFTDITKRVTGFTGQFHRGVWVITVISLFNSFSFAICLPFLFLYLNTERGVPASVIGFVILAAGVISAFSQIYGGMLSDRIGRRPMVIAAIFLGAVSYSLLAVLIGISAPVWAIAATYIFSRVTVMTVRPTLSTIVADLSSGEGLTKAYGLLRTGLNLGWAIGPAIGGYLLAIVSYSWLFGLATIASVLPLVLVLAFLKETRDSNSQREKISFENIKIVLKNRSFIIYVGLTFMFLIAFGQLVSTLSIYTIDFAGFSTVEYGSLLTLNGVIVVLFQYPVAYYTCRLTKYRTLVAGAIIYGAGLLLYSWVGSYALGLVAMFIITLGEIIYSPVALSLVGDIAPSSRRGLYMGTYSLSETLGHSLGPFIGGILLDVFPSRPLLIWGTVAMFAFLPAIGFWRWGRQKATPPSCR